MSDCATDDRRPTIAQGRLWVGAESIGLGQRAFIEGLKELKLSALFMAGVSHRPALVAIASLIWNQNQNQTHCCRAQNQTRNQNQNQNRNQSRLIVAGKTQLRNGRAWQGRDSRRAAERSRSTRKVVGAPLPFRLASLAELCWALLGSAGLCWANRPKQTSPTAREPTAESREPTTMNFVLRRRRRRVCTLAAAAVAMQPLAGHE